MKSHFNRQDFNLGSVEPEKSLFYPWLKACRIKITCVNECLRGTSHPIHQNSTCTFPATCLSTQPQCWDDRCLQPPQLHLPTDFISLLKHEFSMASVKPHSSFSRGSFSAYPWPTSLLPAESFSGTKIGPPSLHSMYICTSLLISANQLIFRLSIPQTCRNSQSTHSSLSTF